MNNTELTFPMKKDREPKVIVFKEPGKNKAKVKAKKRPKKIDAETDEEDDFISVAKEVKEFGITGFTRKEQKRNQQKHAEYLGAHKQKQQKVPYPMLMERIKKRKLKETKEKELERAMGIFKKKKKTDDVKLTTKLNLGRWVDKSNLGKISATSNNKIRVNKNDVFKKKPK